MATTPVGTRLEKELFDAFIAEAARRGQDRAQLLRTFVRDGLARYDSYSEQIIQTQLAILENVKKLQDMTGAALHIHAEQSVLALQQKPDESADQYRQRLRAAYKEEVFQALEKGARIATATVPAAVTQGPRQ